ncbi:MAG TPA: hypothetical protein VL576_00395 [Candidatus Paceibacterota bacterium]|nr:hypothetical protein [Candidatus Paceibacterota bacterium]
MKKVKEITLFFLWLCYIAISFVLMGAALVLSTDHLWLTFVINFLLLHCILIAMYFKRYTFLLPFLAMTLGSFMANTGLSIIAFFILIVLMIIFEWHKLTGRILIRYFPFKI